MAPKENSVFHFLFHWVENWSVRTLGCSAKLKLGERKSAEILFFVCDMKCCNVKQEKNEQNHWLMAEGIAFSPIKIKTHWQCLCLFVSRLHCANAEKDASADWIFCSHWHLLPIEWLHPLHLLCTFKSKILWFSHTIVKQGHKEKNTLVLSVFWAVTQTVERTQSSATWVQAAVEVHLACTSQLWETIRTHWFFSDGKEEVSGKRSLDHSILLEHHWRKWHADKQRNEGSKWISDKWCKGLTTTIDVDLNCTTNRKRDSNDAAIWQCLQLCLCFAGKWMFKFVMFWVPIGPKINRFSEKSSNWQPSPTQPNPTQPNPTQANKNATSSTCGCICCSA